MIVTLLQACGLQLRAGALRCCGALCCGAAVLRRLCAHACSRHACHAIAAQPSGACRSQCPLSCSPFAADPVAMKDFVVAVHARAAQAGGAGRLTKRAQILLELVVDVKNNRWAGQGGCLAA